MSEYDSILKEKKKITSPLEPEPPKKKRFPTFTLSLIAVILILIISYIIYFNTILAQDKIIINDLNYLKDQYKIIFDNLHLEPLLDNNLEATIILNENTTYSIIKDENNYYLKTPTLNKYVNNLSKKSFNLNLENPLANISKEKYIKTFYVKNQIPIVESNLVLSKNELENIIGMRLINEYEVIITAQNHALTNKIIMFKVVITNKITSDRKVITIENNNIYYKDKNCDLRFEFSAKNNDFNIKVYKGDILYSVITGTEKLNTYNYAYQIIDKLYTLNLSTTMENGTSIYEFSSRIDGVEETATITLSDPTGALFELLNYDDLTDVDKIIYDAEEKKLLEFVNKYQDNIQNIND